MIHREENSLLTLGHRSPEFFWSIPEIIPEIPSIPENSEDSGIIPEIPEDILVIPEHSVEKLKSNNFICKIS